MSKPRRKAEEKFHKILGKDAPDDEAEVQPWKNVFRPTCAQTAKDNSFALDDEVLSAAVEGFLSSLTVSDPGHSGLCYVSSGFTAMTGYNEHECLGRDYSFLQAGKGDAAALEALRSGLQERRCVTCELTTYRKDGRAFQNLLSLVPVLGGDSASLLHYIGVQCDLDERRRRGEAVDDAFVAKWQEQVKHYLTAFALIDVSGGGSASSGAGSSGGGNGSGRAGASSSASPPATAVCAVSPGFTSLTGFSQSDVLGWNMLCLCGPDTSERDMRKLITSQWSHTPATVKLLCYKQDGTPFWALIFSCPLTITSSSTVAAGSGQGQGGRDAAGGTSTSGRHGHAYRSMAGRAGGLGLDGLLGGSAAGGAGGLLGSGLTAGSTAGGCAGPPSAKYCLCCVVDITAQRLKRISGGKYALGKVIGAGAFGMVRIGKNMSTDELVAVKSVDATRFRNINEIDQIQGEMAVLASLKHPHIIRLYDVHFQSNTFFLVMEFAGGGSLVHFTRSHGDPVHHCLDEATAGRVFVQMVSALDYCHRRRVIHRDLKPENILMDEKNNLKIADFGLAAVTAPFSGGLTLQCGTPGFTAPEITVGREYDGASVDIWSMGVILYEALSGTLPFKGANQAALFKAIQKGLCDPLPSHVSPDCKDLVRRMLVVDPLLRTTMDEMLRHPWVVKAATNAAALGGSGSTMLQGSISVGHATEDGAVGSTGALLTRKASGTGSGAGGSSIGLGASALEGGRPHSAAWRECSGAGEGPGERAGEININDVSDNGPGYRASQRYILSRPTSANLAGGGGQGPPSPSNGQETGLGLVGSSAGPPGGLHDSVKLVIPSVATDRDDPILAAILRGHSVSADSNQPSRNADDDSDVRVQPSSQSVSPASAARRDSTPASTSSSRMGAGSRSMGGMPTAAGGGLHGPGQNSGKARGSALLPTLGSGGSTSNPAPNCVLDRRPPESSRFRSPARGTPTPAAGSVARGGGVSTGRMQQSDRQLPPIIDGLAGRRRGRG